MNSFTQKAFEIITDDPEQLFAALSGSATNFIIHPQKVCAVVVKAALVGFFLAEFVSPAVAERLDLSRKESIALSFICGYAGCRAMRLAEKAFLERIQRIGGTEGMSTLPSKPVEEEGAASAGAASGEEV